MPKPRIRENFRLWKSKVNNYLNNKNVITINDMETELLKQNLISVNFDDYILKKMSLINMIYSGITSIVILFWAIKVIAMSFIKDTHILKLTGNPFYLTEDHMALHISLAIFNIIASKFRLIYISGKFFHLILRFRHNICRILLKLVLEFSYIKME
jgi:hypothetical protein